MIFSKFEVVKISWIDKADRKRIGIPEQHIKKKKINGTHFSECQNHMYGAGCSEKCGYCLDGEQCDHVNGTCLNGCEAGYHQIRCKTGRYNNTIHCYVLTIHLFIDLVCV